MINKEKVEEQTHGVMFHHFHDSVHPVSQGSISADEFSKMLDWLCEKYTLLDSDQYLHKLTHNTLKKTDIVLTFDDALLCQVDIAAPILKARNLRAFFFIYSSPFLGDPDFLEVYRYFRTTQFSSINEFYQHFFCMTELLYENKYNDAKEKYKNLDYLKDFSFYSEEDKWFRFLRDKTLGKEIYDEIMSSLMESANFFPKEILDKLWMKNEDLNKLKADGHIIGLHSYSHPTIIHELSKSNQVKEYQKNIMHLTEVLNEHPMAMSHPCGNYNTDTLDILNINKIKIGFRSNLKVKKIESSLEVPRKDHSDVLVEMQK